MTIHVKTFVKPPLSNNNYVVIDDVSNEAILIDCSEPTDEVMKYIKQQKAELKYILLTHAHFDHVLGVHYFQKKYHIPVYGSLKDESLLKQLNDYMALVKLPAVEEPEMYADVEKQALSLGKNSIRVLATPGHTEGGVCYLIKNMLFSGDTLFNGSHGRTDLPGGDDIKMKQSLQMLFKLLPDKTVVYPGHGSETTIGAEKLLYK